MASNQKQTIEQAKFTYSALENAFEKQTKAIEDQGKKQIDALNTLKPKELVKSDKLFILRINQKKLLKTI